MGTFLRHLLFLNIFEVMDTLLQWFEFTPSGAMDRLKMDLFWPKNASTIYPQD